jgi:anti-sigma factor RsiW
VRCSSCEPLLDRYLEGTLSSRQMAAVSSHVRACDRCSSLVQELRVVDALLGSTKAVAIAPNFSFAVMAEVRTIPMVERRAISPWSVLWFYLVGAWIALGGTYALFGVNTPWLKNLAAMFLVPAREMFAAIGGIAHSFGSALPLTIGVVGAVLFLDALLAGALVLFIRTIRPRLVASLARSEAP